MCALYEYDIMRSTGKLRFARGTHENLREFAGNNIPILCRIFVRIQGATMDEYWTYSSIVATQNTDKKTSKMGVLFFATSLTIFYSYQMLADRCKKIGHPSFCSLHFPANGCTRIYTDE